jgi:hypothetical protein
LIQNLHFFVFAHGRQLDHSPKIRDEVLKDAVTLGEMGFHAHFGQCNGGWFPANRLCG